MTYQTQPRNEAMTKTGHPYTYIGVCCREWIMATGFAFGTCGLCGERPTYLRDDAPAPTN